MLAYIGSPIDGDKNPVEVFKELSDLVVEAARSKGHEILVYNPLTAFVNACNIGEHKACKSLASVNYSALSESDVAVFAWTDTPSFGVPVEIEYCVDNRIPFVIWYKASKKPGVYLTNAINNGIAKLYKDRDSVLNHVAGIVEGYINDN